MLGNGLAYATAASWDGTRWLDSSRHRREWEAQRAIRLCAETFSAYFSVLVFRFYKCKGFNFG